MKKFRALTATVLTFAMAFSVAGCGGFKVIDDEDVFFDALDEAVSIDKDETHNSKNTTVEGDKVEYLIFVNDGDNYYTYIRFKDEDDALDYFDDFYSDFEDIEEAEEFTGTHVASMGKVRGSVILNGEFSSSTSASFYNNEHYFYDDSEVFGGVYVNHNVYIEAYSIEGSKRDKEKISMFLKEIGFPKP